LYPSPGRTKVIVEQNLVERDNNMKNNKGFTLVEMMVIIGIVAILALITIPNIASWRPKAALSSASRTLKADLGMAKSRAIRDNSTITVTFDTANGTYRITDNGGNTIKARRFTGLSISGTTFAGNTVTFDRRGRSSSAGDISLTNSSGTIQIVITLLGSIQVIS